MSKKRIILVRHGQENVAARRGELGGELTELGVRQARLTGERLSRLAVDRIVASSLPRAAQTAALIADIVQIGPIEQSELLWEALPSIPAGYEHLFVGLAESGQVEQDLRRASAAYEHYILQMDDDSRCQLVVCHGNIIRYFVTRVRGLPVDHWHEMHIGNCSVTILDFDDDQQPRLHSFNDLDHLPESLQTYV
ncbi:MAG: histidine phosphatase family protein [Anaerolineales bacterium]|nr:histidine phosphatase family protein [Anaerolineales bacterium]